MTTAQLTFVGLGFCEGDVTLATLAALRRATKIYYYHESSGPPWLEKLFPDAEDIFSVTEGDTADRRHRYENTVELLLSKVREGHVVACAFYGSAVFHAIIAHMAVTRAREQSITVQILPGISCFESLLCDLAGHPTAAKALCRGGITIITAPEYLQNPARFSQFVPLVLLMVGHVNALGDAEDRAGLTHLSVMLGRMYDPFHECVLYHCSAQGPPIIRTLPVSGLPKVAMPPEGWSAVTLFVPPFGPNPIAQLTAAKRAFAAGIRYARIQNLIQQRQNSSAETENRKLIK